MNSPFPFIAFLGPDGAGKSTVIEGVMAEFSKRRLHGHRVHWRPNFCKNGTAEPQMVTDPHQVSPRGKVTSIVKLFYFWADWFFSHHLPLRHLRAKNKVVIADRFYMDLLADPRRYRYGASLWPARKLFSLFPKPDLTIILTGDAETLYLRKKEVALDEVKRQIKVYEMLGECRAINPCVVTASRPLEEVHADVWRQVMSVLRNRT